MQDGVAVGGDHAVPPRAVDAFEPEAPEEFGGAADRVGVFGDVPGDVFRLRRAEAGGRQTARPAAVPATKSPLPDAKPQAAAPVERYNDYTYETGPAAAPVSAVPAGPQISTSTSWVSRNWLGVRRVCRSLLGRMRPTSPPTHVTTSQGCKSQEVPTC